MTAATASQTTYAASLQAELAERATWTVADDTDPMWAPGAAHPDLADLYAARRAAERGSPEREALGQQLEDKQREIAIANRAGYITRLTELTAADLDTMDREQISAYIDSAKRVLGR